MDPCSSDPGYNHSQTHISRPWGKLAYGTEEQGVEKLKKTAQRDICLKFTHQASFKRLISLWSHSVL